MSNNIADKFSGVTDSGSALKAIKTIAAGYRRGLAGMESKQVEAAYATWEAVHFGVIREGRKDKNSPAVEMEHAEYAALFDGGEGTVKSQVGLWIVMGYGLAVLNIDPTSDLFKRLRKGLQFGKVKEALRKCETSADLAEFETFLNIWVDENGNKRNKDARRELGSGEEADPARTTASEKDNGGEEKVLLSSETAPAIVKALIRDLAVAIKELDDEHVKAASKAAFDVFRAEQAVRDAATKPAAGKPGAKPRKRAAKKAA